jgi:DNA-binding CsgD family transcriptional regulator/tetratricopeptide (TPR) repeat protein
MAEETIRMTDLPPAWRGRARRGGSSQEAGAVYGREPELRAVLELVRRAAKGRGDTLLIEGELGAGKSLLLRCAASEARAEGVSVAAAAADELSRFMPLSPVLTALGESSAALAIDANRPGQADLAAWLIDFLRTQLEKRAAVGPLLVSLDDLHWADPATLHALRTLPGQLASYPLAWILARRSPDRSNDAELLFDLLQGGGAARVTLETLSDGAVADMVADALGAVPDADLLALAAGAGGNPLLLAELLTGLVEENAVAVTAGRARLRSAQVPRRIQEAVRDTLGGLGVATRQLLETASVLGRSFQLEDVAAMLDISPAALLPALQEALASGVLAATREALVFRHEMVWQAVGQTLPLPVRHALHRQIGEFQLARGSAASAAAHLLSCASGGDRAALAGLDRAAAEVLPSSPPIAADLRFRALQLTPPGDPEVIGRSLVAAEALTAAGRFEEAAKLARSALAMPLPTATSARLRCALSSALWLSGQPGEAMTEAMLVLAQPQLPGELRAEAKIALLEGMTLLHDNRRAGRLAASILTASQRERTDVVIIALVAQAVVMWDRGRLAEALDLSAEAVRMARGQRLDPRHFQPHLFLASRLVDVRRFEQARSILRSCGEPAGPLGVPGWSATPATLRARMSLADGQLDDAVAEAQTDISMASTTGNRLHGPGASAVLATVALRVGDLSLAARHMQTWREQRPHFGEAYADTWDKVMTAQIEEARNGPRAAVSLLERVYAELPTHRFLIMYDPACAAWLVRTALSADDPGRARTAVLAADEISRASPEIRVAAISAAHAGGLADRDPTRLEQAVTGHADPWARASAVEDLAQLLVAAGRRGDAITRLDQAIEGYEATGAARDTARVRRRLRRLGVRRRHRAVETGPTAGWPSLTGTERAVSELVAQGFTNQQAADRMFISVHTVAFHLRQVFRKLGISSRVELARMATGQPERPGPR